MLKLRNFLECMILLYEIRLWCVSMIFLGWFVVLFENGSIVMFFLGFMVMLGMFELLFLRSIESDLYLFMLLMMKILLCFSFCMVFFV